MSSPTLQVVRRQQFVDLGHHLEGIGDVKHVGLAARPAAIRVQIDGAALADETPADRVRFFAVTAGAQTFRMPRRRAGLADLVQVRQERQHRLAFAAQVHQRFAAAERRARLLAENRESIFPPPAHASGRRPVSSSSPRR